MKLRTLLLILSIAIFQKVTFAQSPKMESKKPSPESLAAAYKASTDVFTKLSAGKTEEVASWIADEIGYTRDPASRMTLKGDFKNKLDLIMTSPPVTPYGKISGYDLINESYLPNSGRYFRLIYEIGRASCRERVS